MLALLASLIVAGALATAAAMKLAEPHGARVALATYGFAGRAATPAWALLVATELVVAVALLGATALAAGDDTAHGGAAGVAAGAALAAAGVFVLFAVAAVAALAAGRGGAPCGCLGGRGALSATTVARAVVLALLAGLAAVPALAGGTVPDALDVASAPGWLGLAGALAAAVVAVLAALILHRAPDGALAVADEGPAVGEAIPGVDARGLLLFTSDGCGLCARVRRGVRGLPVTELEEERDAAAWHAARVPGAPYAVLVAENGTVLAKGAVNTGAQVRSLLAARLAGPTPAAGTVSVVPVTASAGGGSRLPAALTTAGRLLPGRPANATTDAADGGAPLPGSARDEGSRRRFLGRSAAATATLTAAGAVGRLVHPGEAEAYHFCGHIYTTDSCPHPTGLPRIDARGLPLRAKDGHRVDDLGRLVDTEGYAVAEDGRRLVDPDGRTLPRAPRTRVCTATARAYKQSMQVDGAWYRCCKGHVRKLVDCCTDGDRRINGDKALQGYCYADRKVFCVMFFQTKVPC